MSLFDLIGVERAGTKETIHSSSSHKIYISINGWRRQDAKYDSLPTPTLMRFASDNMFNYKLRWNFWNNPGTPLPLYNGTSLPRYIFVGIVVRPNFSAWFIGPHRVYA